MIKYKNWVLDSEEELFFCYWMEELKEAGYINEFSRIEDPILIFDKVSFDFFIRGKKEVKPLIKSILRPLSYTPDFFISWTEKADSVFIAIRNNEYYAVSFKKCIFYTEEDMTSVIDVKGTFRNPRILTATTFPIIQKILAYKGIYVQKIVPFGKSGLFAKTFTPNQYNFTPTGKFKKIPWKVLNLNQYLNNKI